MIGPTCHRAASASSGSGLRHPMIPQCFIWKGQEFCPRSQGYVMIGRTCHCASSASSASGLFQSMIPRCFICKRLPSTCHRASSASSGSGLPDPMIPQWFIRKGIQGRVMIGPTCHCASSTSSGGSRMQAWSSFTPSWPATLGLDPRSDLRE